MRLSSEDLNTILSKTDALWHEMRKGRLFLTGGTGFFGRWLLEPLLHAVDRKQLATRVVVLTRSPKAFREKAPHLADHPAVELLHGDVTSFDLNAPALNGITHIIHAAGYSRSSSLPEITETVVQGTRRVLLLAQQKKVRRFLHLSSGAVYGPQPPALTHLAETYSHGAPDLAPTPQNVLGESQRMAELLCQIAYAEHRLHATTVRCFNFVGPLLPAHLPLTGFISDALEGGPVRVQDDGTPVASYLYAADLAIWLWSILQRGEAGRVYNVGSPEEISTGQLAELIGTLYHCPVTLASPPASGVPPTRYVPDTRRAECELGLIRTTPLSEALRKTTEWYRSQLLSRAG